MILNGIKSWDVPHNTVVCTWLTMERLLQGLLALSVLLACNHAVSVAAAEAAVNVTGGYLVQEISNSLCTANHLTVFSRIFHYCAQDDVPTSKCGEYLFGDVTLIY